MKEKLLTILGGFGLVVWYIVSIIYSFAPLYFLGLPFWVDFILIVVMTSVPFIGEIVRIGIFIWAFTIVIAQPIDVVSIIFFVCAALYLITTVIPMIMALFARKQA